MISIKYKVAPVLACLAVCCGTVTRGDDAAYRSAMAKAVRAAASRVLPSVVTIEIVGAGANAAGEVEQDAPTAGVIVDADGLIIASSIVVRRPSASILVKLPDGSRHAAEVLARDHHRDLVLLKIKSKTSLPAIELPGELDLRIGQTTISVGRYGSDASPMVSSGVLSATGRLDGIALQTDARVSPSLYGGPLVDLEGNLLGILIPAVAEGGAEDATSWYDSGIAFAIPVDVLTRKLVRLRAGEDINKGLIGIVAKSKDPFENGTEIAAVRTRSPAEASGIKAGDRVVSVAGKPVRRHQEIRQVLGEYDAGDSVVIKIQRGESTEEISVTLAESIPPLQPQWLGLIASERSIAAEQKDAVEKKDTVEQKDNADEKGEEQAGDKQPVGKRAVDGPTDEVVVDAIVPGSPLDGKLEPGDVITSASGAGISDIPSLRRKLISAAPGKPIQIAYRRDGEQGTVAVTPRSIAGPIHRQVPSAWTEIVEVDWLVSELKLPDAANVAAYVAPKNSDDLSQLGLLMLLLNPGQGSPAEVLKTWSDLAKQAGVVVCAVAPENNSRWQQKEIDLISRFAAAMTKKAAIDSSAVAVAAAGGLGGGKAEAGDSMALAVSIAANRTFFGVAVSSETRPPAVRLKDNDAEASLQVLLPIDSEDDLPTWGAGLQKAGYPIVLGGDVEGVTLLRWVRLLQSI